jgi:hypothetical protein
MSNTFLRYGLLSLTAHYKEQCASEVTRTFGANGCRRTELNYAMNGLTLSRMATRWFLILQALNLKQYLQYWFRYSCPYRSFFV